MFEPELGQAVFSNGSQHPCDMAGIVESGLVMLAHAIAEARNEDPDRDGLLVSNYGCDPFESDVFSMRTYCWCDGDRPGHEDDCPPNFIHHPSGFAASWYKHVGRGASQNRHIRASEWAGILVDCLAVLTPAPRRPRVPRRPGRRPPHTDTQPRDRHAGQGGPVSTETQPVPHDRTQALVAEAASVLEEIYDPAGVLIFWSSRIKYLDNHRPCDLYRDKDDAMLERLVQHLNAFADGNFS